MKYSLKIIILILSILLFTNTSALAGTSLKETLDSIIGKNPISRKTLVSVSIRDTSNGKLIYQRYGDYLLHPASTLKAFTTPVALNYLGVDSFLTTGLYKSNNHIYIKLNGDPLLTSDDLVDLIKNSSLKAIKGNIIIDDTAIDDIPWGVGWMWDDENNSLMPKYNSYNLDHNLIKVQVIPTVQGKKVMVKLLPDYGVKIENYAITTNTQNIAISDKLKVERKPWLDPETIYITGKVSKSDIVTIPIGNPKHYFFSKLMFALKSNNVSLDGHIQTGKIPSDATLITMIRHKVKEVVSNTNQNSDNLGAETLLKLAGKKYSNKTGSTYNGLEAMKAFYDSLGAPISSQEIVDGSGASHNDLVQSNWMTLALVNLYNSSIKEAFLPTLAQPSQNGTLKNRLKIFTNKLWAKTGTLSGISGIAGYLKTKTNSTYAFSILIQNYKGSSAGIKELENKIIQTVYNY